MSICVVCKEEIWENEHKIKYGLDVHIQCEIKIIYYDNPSLKDTVLCCKEEVYLKPTFLNGWLKGIGQCKCGKIHITDRFPKNPKPRDTHIPKKGLLQ